MKKQGKKSNIAANRKRVKRIQKIINSAGTTIIITVGLSLASIIVAAGFSLYQTFQLKNQTDQLKNQTNHLQEITQSLPTRCLGKFPDFMNEINQLLEETIKDNTTNKDTIVIFQDVLTYGLYSNPAEFERLISNILELRNKGYYIKIFIYNKKRKIQNRLIQFCNDKNLDYENLTDEQIEKALLDTVAQNEKFSTFAKYPFGESSKNNQFLEIRYRRDSLLTQFQKNSKTITKKQLFILLDEMSNVIYQILLPESYNHSAKLKNLIIINCDIKFNIHCWSNGKATIFSLPRYSKADELGFSTRDPEFFRYIEYMREDNEKNKANFKK